MVKPHLCYSGLTLRLRPNFVPKEPDKWRVVGIGKFIKPPWFDSSLHYVKLKSQLMNGCQVLVEDCCRTRGIEKPGPKSWKRQQIYIFNNNILSPVKSNLSMPLLDDIPIEKINDICQEHGSMQPMISPMRADNENFSNNISETSSLSSNYCATTFPRPTGAKESKQLGPTNEDLNVLRKKKASKHNSPFCYLILKKFDKFEKFLRRNAPISSKMIRDILNIFRNNLGVDEVLDCLRVVMEKRKVDQLASILACGYFRILQEQSVNHDTFYRLMLLCIEHQVDIITEDVTQILSKTELQYTIVQVAYLLAEYQSLKSSVEFLIKIKALIDFIPEDSPIYDLLEEFSEKLKLLISNKARKELVQLLDLLTCDVGLA